MTASTAIVPTASASRYLQQLCKHWSHKFDVKFDAARGHVPLPMGTVVLVASGEALTVNCAVPEGGDLERMQDVVVQHLNRFAFREGELVFEWLPA